MTWYVYVIHFIAALFVANSIPHFVNGISGRSFPSPFARAPGRGQSSAPVNVVWGGINMSVAGLLLWFWPMPAPLQSGDVVVFATGFFLAAIGLASAFSRRNLAGKER